MEWAGSNAVMVTMLSLTFAANWEDAPLLLLLLLDSNFSNLAAVLIALRLWDLVMASIAIRLGFY